MALTGRVALVTGASRGIGREVALALARAGASVALVARDRAALEAVAAEIGTDRSLVLAADLTELGALHGIIQATLDRFGRVDVLINNAGQLSGRDFLASDPLALAQTVDLNFRAAVVLTRLAAAAMAGGRGGHIVNVASLAGVTGLPGEPVYAGTKAALRLFTASLRDELRVHGVTLTDVVIGTTGTDMLEEVERNPRVRRLFNRGRRLGLLLDSPAEEVAGAIVRAVERRQPVIVMPGRARLLILPLQGLTRSVVRLLAR